MCSVGRKKKFNDQPFPYHAEIELEITTLTNLGSGLGRVVVEKLKADSLQPEAPAPAAGAGWVVMVPFTLPGERVRARVYRNHRNFSEADLVTVLTPSPERVAPRCPLFGQCGGCQYQHLAYPAQLTWKRRQVEELLEHLAGVGFAVAPTVPSPREYGYRSKITPHFSAPAREKISPIGFLRQGTRFDLLDVPECPIATPEINHRLTEVRAQTRQRLAAGEYQRGATLLLRHAQEGVVTDYDAVIHEVIDLAGSAGRAPASADETGQTGSPTPATETHTSGLHAAPKPREGEATLHSQPDSAAQLSSRNSQPESSTPLRLHFLARDFFQNNPFILPAFSGYVRSQAAATGARCLVDAYCGSGLFALACAPAFARVAGIEVSESSVRFARENAAANGLANATFRAGDAAAIFAGLDFPPADTVVVIDPPRKGCDELFLQQLFTFGPRGVVYVSCDPATQMRDLKLFLAAGYLLTAVQPFDLFPQTRHLECVITLRRA
ncbi:MAG: 23S rRNA (uracil(1939)-C(5))-methyltransferase RlmD [Opitutales bacterium]